MILLPLSLFPPSLSLSFTLLVTTCTLYRVSPSIFFYTSSMATVLIVVQIGFLYCKLKYLSLLRFILRFLNSRFCFYIWNFFSKSPTKSAVGCRLTAYRSSYRQLVLNSSIIAWRTIIYIKIYFGLISLFLLTVFYLFT